MICFVILTSSPNNKAIQCIDFQKTTLFLQFLGVGMFLNAPQQRLQYNNEGLTVFHFCFIGQKKKV